MTEAGRFSGNVAERTWRCGTRIFRFVWPRDTIPLLIGIVNTTPDSFSDGGEYLDPDRAVRHALRLVEEGAQIIDIGGESTRPGSDPVSADVELSRVVPVIERLRRQSDVTISVDTSKAEVARQAILAGAQIINDVTATRCDPAMIDVLAGSDAGLIILHMRGTPKTMQQQPSYSDVVEAVRSFLSERTAWLQGQGVARDRIALDPGIGFGKTTVDNLQLINQLGSLCELGRPVCVGVSRKSLIGRIVRQPPRQLLGGTLAATLEAYRRGAGIMRVHDVAAARDALLVANAIEQPDQFA